MKSAFGLFMSVYLLLLSVLPCADGCLPLRPTDTPAQFAAGHQDRDADQPHADLCSPLCSCACCGTVLGQPPVFSFQYRPAELLLTTTLPGLLTPTLSSVALGTWQPPQLG